MRDALKPTTGYSHTSSCTLHYKENRYTLQYADPFSFEFWQPPCLSFPLQPWGREKPEATVADGECVAGARVPSVRQSFVASFSFAVFVISFVLPPSGLDPRVALALSVWQISTMAEHSLLQSSAPDDSK
jgi:hypothetical protein